MSLYLQADYGGFSTPVGEFVVFLGVIIITVNELYRVDQKVGSPFFGFVNFAKS